MRARDAWEIHIRQLEHSRSEEVLAGGGIQGDHIFGFKGLYQPKGRTSA
jgi:hypothetical protein